MYGLMQCFGMPCSLQAFHCLSKQRKHANVQAPVNCSAQQLIGETPYCAQLRQCLPPQAVRIGCCENFMQLALALKTFVKCELRAARVVILLLALTGLLSRAASEPLSDALAGNGFVVSTSKEAGSDAAVTGAEGLRTGNRSQHLGPSATIAKPPPGTTSRGSDYAAPPVCQAPQLFQQFVTPAADCCPASGVIESAHDISVCSAPADTNDTAIQQNLVPADKATTQTQLHPSEASPSSEEERHNFALSKDGAKIIANNKEAKKASAILDTDSDTFMKNECKADKWFIIELSQVAKVAAFQLSQYELYSSRVKEFEVRGRQAHPRAQGGDYTRTLNTTGWTLLGRYTAAKMKGSQVFTVAEPVWLKYIQFHFISHHGSEPICALNDVLVFGKSAAEDLEDQLSDEALLTVTHSSNASTVLVLTCMTLRLAGPREAD
ncbi:hypothetical protein ABBQ38_004118 [Trebouxia sp. C0009 RCD-2024]